LLVVGLTGSARAEPPPAPPLADDEADVPAPALSAEELRAAEQRYAREPKSKTSCARRCASRRARARPSSRRARARRLGSALSFRARRGTTVDLSAPQSLDATRCASQQRRAHARSALSFELDRVIFRHEEIALLHRAAPNKTRVRGSCAT